MDEASTILVPVDFSAHSRAAAERAMLLANVTGDRIHLLYSLHWPLIDSGDNYAASFWDDLRRIEGAKFESIVREYTGRGPSLTTRFDERDPADAVRLAARAPGVELIVMGSHGRRGPAQGVLGSVAERTIHDVLIPVLIVREGAAEAAKPIRSILFATDFSDGAEGMEKIVAAWARHLSAEVEVFHAIRETESLFAPYAVTGSVVHEAELSEAARVRMNGSLARFAAAGVYAKSKIVHGFASEEITSRAESTGAQLIAMGTRGYAGLQRYRLGSVAHRVLRQAPCSVLVGPAHS